MDPPTDPTRRPVPDDLRPMRSDVRALDALDVIGADDVEWAVELRWTGERVLVTCRAGDVRVHAADGREITAALPDVRRMGRATGSLELVLDGVVAEVDGDGRPTMATGGLQRRLAQASDTTWRKLARQFPAAFLAFDVLWLEGHSTMALTWSERRDLLEQLELTGPAWHTPSAHRGEPTDIIEAARGAGVSGVVLKALDSVYEPGAATSAWIEIRFVEETRPGAGTKRRGES
jgi:bifunctional non-homologous end joining protein LigD